MQQTLEKAGAKAEAILRKLVESGKLQPGSLGKVRTSSYYSYRGGNLFK